MKYIDSSTLTLESTKNHPENKGGSILHIAGILIGLGLVCYIIYRLAKSTTCNMNIGPESAASKLSASELAHLLNI